jgi:error-prone DNA polymerase
MGVFQIESRAQMQTLPRVRPRNLDDLSVQVAIIRPGPIVGGSVNPYINRRMGKEPVTFDHPSLEPALEETMGVILYQEQVLQVAMALANFSAGQADSLRRAMSRKRSREAIEKLKQQFIDGALANNVSLQTAETVFRKISGFAEFGFPKAHAAAFGLLAYQTAWLRTYYPAEFLCALFNAQPMGFYAPHVLVNDGKRHGIEVRSPDINLSDANCSIENGAVRVGLRYVRGLSEDAAKQVKAERMQNGPYRSLFDFLERTYVKQQVIENLVAVGCFDSFGLERREMLWQLGLLYRSEGRNTVQRQLALALPTEQDMVELRPMTDWEKMRTDYLIIEMSPNAHPMAFIRPSLNEGIVNTKMVASIEDGKQIEMAGLVVCRQQPGTAKDFVFLVLEDEFGLVNVIVRPDIHETQRHLVRREPFVMIKGTLQRRDGVTNLMAQTFTALEVADRLEPASHNFG